MSDQKGKRIVYDVTYISKYSLCVAEYQREEKPAHFGRIMNAFDVELFQPLEVSFRDGKYYVVEGQHRWRGVMEHSEFDELPCRVHHWTYEQEALMFARYNDNKTRAPVTTAETLHASNEAGEPEARKLTNMLHANGFTSRKDDSDEGSLHVKWVGTIKRVFAIDPAKAEWIVSFLSRAARVHAKKFETKPDATMFLVESLEKLYIEPTVRNNANILADRLGRYGLHKAHTKLRTTNIKQLRPGMLVKILESGKNVNDRLINREALSAKGIFIPKD